jgi:hypothetical protein
VYCIQRVRIYQMYKFSEERTNKMSQKLKFIHFQIDYESEYTSAFLTSFWFFLHFTYTMHGHMNVKFV